MSCKTRDRAMPDVDKQAPTGDDDDQFFVRMFKHDFEDDPGWIAPPSKARMGIVITSDSWGQGDAKLGHILIREFLMAVLEKETHPQAIFLIHAGVKLGVRGAGALDLLQKIEAQGVRILVSESSLYHFGVPTALRVGESVSMSEIVEHFYRLEKVITL